ncbi:MAG TPA: tetratricopeptide repeat protein, partial [Bacteroidetes bacterium]|nr:tetratricopeptide repeat protein [Bacteroidota bacterium]
MSYRRKNSNSGTIFLIIFLMIVFGGGLSKMFLFGAIFYGIYRFIESQKESNQRERGANRDFERRKYRRPTAQNRTPRERPQRTPRKRERPRRSTIPSKPKQNPFKISGIKKYKEYEYEAAIEDFKKALSVDPTDVAVHFNIACAYSIMEEPHLSMVHLAKAVEHGF